MTSKANKTPARSAAKKSAAPVVRSERVTQKRIEDNPEAALYEVLQPFKFQGSPVRPPAFIELTAAEALPYQEAGLLGTEPGEPLSADDAGDTTPAE